MKKFAQIITAGIATVALVSCLSLIGCGGSGSNTNTASNSASNASSNSSSSASSGTGSQTSSTGYTLIKDGTLTIGTYPDSSPFESLEDGKYVGFDIAFGEALAEELGLDASFTTIDLDDILSAVADGDQCDVAISSLAITSDSQSQVDMSSSYYTDALAIACMKSSKVTDVKAFNDPDVTIAVQSGSSGEAYVKEHFKDATVKGFDSTSDAFAALQAGNADAVITSKTVAESMVQNTYSDASIVKSIDTGEEYGVAIGKNNAELSADINSAISKMKSDGTIDKLLNKYL